MNPEDEWRKGGRGQLKASQVKEKNHPNSYGRSWLCQRKFQVSDLSKEHKSSKQCWMNRIDASCVSSYPPLGVLSVTLLQWSPHYESGTNRLCERDCEGSEQDQSVRVVVCVRHSGSYSTHILKGASLPSRTSPINWEAVEMRQTRAVLNYERIGLTLWHENMKNIKSWWTHERNTGVLTTGVSKRFHLRVADRKMEEWKVRISLPAFQWGVCAVPACFLQLLEPPSMFQKRACRVH